MKSAPASVNMAVAFIPTAAAQRCPAVGLSAWLQGFRRLIKKENETETMSLLCCVNWQRFVQHNDADFILLMPVKALESDSETASLEQQSGFSVVSQSNDSGGIVSQQVSLMDTP